MTYAVQLRCSLTHAHSRAPVTSLMCTRMKTWSVPNAAFCYCKEGNEKMLSNDRSQLNLDGWFPLSSKSFFKQAPCFISKWTLNMLANHSSHLRSQLLWWASYKGLAPVISLISPTSLLCSITTAIRDGLSSQFLPRAFALPGMAFSKPSWMSTS